MSGVLNTSSDFALCMDTEINMTSRERVKNAMHFKSVDKVPVRYYYCPVGYYEHGEKLNDLYETMPGDFFPFERMPIPVLPNDAFDDNGRFHSFAEDEWGTTWEYRIFGITGIPCKRPVSSLEDAISLKPPIPCDEDSLTNDMSWVDENKKMGYYTQCGCGSLYERLIALYGDENVLCDIATNEKTVNILADKVVEYDTYLLTKALRAHPDGISFGDDYGTQNSLIFSPDDWRRFFKPRLKRLFAPAAEKGVDIHFHSCGYIYDILPDLKEIGVTSIWPQLPAYDMELLAKRCRELSLAVEIHTDRAFTMTYGTPKDVTRLVEREFEVFRPDKGGAWFYIEADNGFPFENIEALVEAIKKYR